MVILVPSKIQHMSLLKMVKCGVRRRRVLPQSQLGEKGAVFIETAMIVGLLLALCLLLLVTGTHIVRYLQVASISQQAIRYANGVTNLPVDGCHTDFTPPSPFAPIAARVNTLFNLYKSYSDTILAPFYLRTVPSDLEICHQYKQGNSGPTEISIRIVIPVEVLFGNSGFVIGGVRTTTTGAYLFEDT